MSWVDPAVEQLLNHHLQTAIDNDDEKCEERESVAQYIQFLISGLAASLGIQGEVKTFGSFHSSLRTSNSDLDVVFLTAPHVIPEAPVSLLSRFADVVPQTWHFTNVTRVLTAKTPLVKFTHDASGMEVDFCVNNRLGVRNSHLLWSYCQYDERVGPLCKLVKDWAKQNGIVGVAEGFLNTYTYVLMTLHYLQQLSPPVICNLQMLATEPAEVTDDKWGCLDCWDTKFVEDVSLLPKSSNTESVAQLLIGFFYFYGWFDWTNYAVSLRLGGEGVLINKWMMPLSTGEEQWYVEDPFDQKHNLAANCSIHRQWHMISHFRKTYSILITQGDWPLACPEIEEELFYLKWLCTGAIVKPQAILQEFEPFGLNMLYFPKQDAFGRAYVFLEFGSAADRRRAHTLNESYIADCQLLIHTSTSYGLAEALETAEYTTYDVASYRMQLEIMAARSETPVKTKKIQHSPESKDPISLPLHDLVSWQPTEGQHNAKKVDSNMVPDKSARPPMMPPGFPMVPMVPPMLAPGVFARPPGVMYPPYMIRPPIVPGMPQFMNSHMMAMNQLGVQEWDDDEEGEEEEDGELEYANEDYAENEATHQLAAKQAHWLMTHGGRGTGSNQPKQLSSTAPPFLPTGMLTFMPPGQLNGEHNLNKKDRGILEDLRVGGQKKVRDGRRLRAVNQLMKRADIKPFLPQLLIMERSDASLRIRQLISKLLKQHNVHPVKDRQPDQGNSKGQNKARELRLPDASEEEWNRRESMRRISIKVAKDMTEYKKYIESLPKEQRTAGEPQTPDAQDRTLSRRTWKRLVFDWRVAVRTWCLDHGHVLEPMEGLTVLT